MELRNIKEEDYALVSEIYKQGIATGIATFETQAPSWKNWNDSHLTTCRIAYFENDKMLGWAALSPISSRCVYGGVAEISVYVSSNSQGKGIGKKLIQQLIIESEKEGYWTLQSGIFSDNLRSINLHLACEFRQVGYRERIGKLNGVWKDNVIMERRSKVVGT
jgi:L-amino acid N-acyltransferase YncA